jgi:hypothetical protein
MRGRRCRICRFIRRGLIIRSGLMEMEGRLDCFMDGVAVDDTRIFMYEYE